MTAPMHSSALAMIHASDWHFGHALPPTNVKKEHPYFVSAGYLTMMRTNFAHIATTMK